MCGPRWEQADEDVAPSLAMCELLLGNPGGALQVGTGDVPPCGLPGDCKNIAWPIVTSGSTTLHQVRLEAVQHQQGLFLLGTHMMARCACHARCRRWKKMNGRSSRRTRGSRGAWGGTPQRRRRQQVGWSGGDAALCCAVLSFRGAANKHPRSAAPSSSAASSEHSQSLAGRMSTVGAMPALAHPQVARRWPALRGQRPCLGLRGGTQS